ncbi:unnamed protein product [Lupinus luteus]|uniref:Uncharacterized protein n=1 Tax=Lupinus luteus TaxID=3873 RepID=A0AAV1W6N2_LUPLU
MLTYHQDLHFLLILILLVIDKIGTTIDEPKEIADIVEEVSEKVDKVAEEAEKELPEVNFKECKE